MVIMIRIHLISLNEGDYGRWVTCLGDWNILFSELVRHDKETLIFLADKGMLSL